MRGRGGGPGMMRGMGGPPRPESLKISLTGKEHGFYSNMFGIAASGAAEVKGAEAV